MSIWALHNVMKEYPEEHEEFLKEYNALFEREQELDLEYMRLLSSKYGLKKSEIAVAFRRSFTDVYAMMRYGLSKGASKEIKLQVKNRDNWSCQDCGVEGGVLHVHHKDDPEVQSMENLVTLCPRCHKKADTALRRNKQKSLS